MEDPQLDPQLDPALIRFLFDLNGFVSAAAACRRAAA